MIPPTDNFILLSLINTKLRDEYSSLSELCEEEDASEDEIISRLSAMGYVYNEAFNSFKAV